MHKRATKYLVSMLIHLGTVVPSVNCEGYGQTGCSDWSGSSLPYDKRVVVTTLGFLACEFGFTK